MYNYSTYTKIIYLQKNITKIINCMFYSFPKIAITPACKIGGINKK